MNGYLSEAGTFLITVLLGFYILMVMLRFLLQTVRADFYNPLSQFLVRITAPALNPLRRFIPGYGGIDMAAVVLLLLLQFLELLLVSLIAGHGLHIGVLLLLTVSSLLKLLLYIYIIAIIVQAVMSWIQPGSYNPVTALIGQLTAPILNPVRRMLPPVSGMDLSPLITLIVLNLLVMAIPHLERGLYNLFG